MIASPAAIGSAFSKQGEWREQLDAGLRWAFAR
jgi:hypothetical protein